MMVPPELAGIPQDTTFLEPMPAPTLDFLWFVYLTCFAALIFAALTAGRPGKE